MNRRDFLCGAAAGLPVAALGSGCQTPAAPPCAACPPPDARLSFSQQGEDLVLYHVLHDYLRLDAPTYLDIGAADPVRANNTYLLHTTGSRGVLVEPNPTFAAKLRAYRPNDRVVEAGVGVSDVAAADYYVIQGQPELNTFSAEQVERLRRRAGHEVVEKVLPMPLIGINRIIAEQLGRAPDLLSIDIEGMDLDILRTLDFDRFRPGVICAETLVVGTVELSAEIPTFLGAKGYVLRGGSFVNSVFVDPARLVPRGSVTPG
jgi:FkbM family methyltransferase